MSSKKEPFQTKNLMKPNILIFFLIIIVLAVIIFFIYKRTNKIKSNLDTNELKTTYSNKEVSDIKEELMKMKSFNDKAFDLLANDQKKMAGVINVLASGMTKFERLMKGSREELIKKELEKEEEIEDIDEEIVEKIKKKSRKNPV